MYVKGWMGWMGCGLAVTLLIGSIPARALAVRPALQAPEEREELKVEGARKATEAERKAAIASIEAQLKAFKADDYATATKYQASGLRRNFETPDDFRRMMRETYPEFASYKSAVFGDARCNPKGDVLQIAITLTGQDRVTVRAVYLMVKEEGQYRVASVFGGIPNRNNRRDLIT